MTGTPALKFLRQPKTAKPSTSMETLIPSELDSYPLLKDPWFRFNLGMFCTIWENTQFGVKPSLFRAIRSPDSLMRRTPMYYTRMLEKNKNDL